MEDSSMPWEGLKVLPAAARACEMALPLLSGGGSSGTGWVRDSLSRAVVVKSLLWGRLARMMKLPSSVICASNVPDRWMYCVYL
jgi:hypothetical protein